MAHTVQSMCDGKGVMNIDGGEWSEGEVSNFRLSGSKNVSLIQELHDKWHRSTRRKKPKRYTLQSILIKETIQFSGKQFWATTDLRLLLGYFTLQQAAFKHLKCEMLVCKIKHSLSGAV